MLLTDLLLRDSTPGARRFFNALAEEPETVAAALMPRVRAVQGSGTSIDYLTPADACEGRRWWRSADRPGSAACYCPANPACPAAPCLQCAASWAVCRRSSTGAASLTKRGGAWRGRESGTRCALERGGETGPAFC